MSSNPKKGGLDRQAGVPRVALRFSTTRNPASISFSYLTRGGSTRQVHLGYRTGTPINTPSSLCLALGSWIQVQNKPRFLKDY